MPKRTTPSRPIQFLRPVKRRAPIWLVLMLALATVAVPGSAQNLTNELQKLKDEQAELQDKKQDKKQQIEAASSEAERLGNQLEAINIELNTRTADVVEAERRLQVAQQRSADSAAATAELEAEMEELEIKLSERAISSFVSQDNSRMPILHGVDPSDVVVMKSLVEAVTDDDLSLAEDLKAIREDLEIEQAVAESVRDEAERIKLELADAVRTLEIRQAEREELAIAAEDELDRQLAEAAALEEMESAVAARIVETNKKLAEQAALASKRRKKTSSGSSPTLTPASDIVKVEGFWVHHSIATSVQAMLDHAASEGHVFTGGGYRDPASQIRLRKAHCGSSNYAIYHMPSSQCRPPTARPGRSMHEQGKALDLRHNGVFISSRSNPGFKWLAANAASYGFYNLPSEPWHWSVNGN